jgi:hypothetical protein
MKLTFCYPKIIWGAIIVLMIVLPTAGYAGSKINDLIVITGDEEVEVWPALAFNSQRNQYLAVWFNDRAGCDDIRAQRIAEDGALIGPSFYISAGCPDDRRYPDVTYNSQHDQYLVVWEQHSASSGYSIKARRVSWDGTLPDTTDITIKSAGYNMYTAVRPVVSYAYTSDRYLVVWAETWHPMPITHTIYGQVLDDTGSLDGSAFVISEGGENRVAPDLAYNRHANRYLVVWEHDAGDLWDIHGRQVHGGGGTYQDEFTIAYYTRSSTNPAVAAIPTSPSDEKFLVVWEIDYAAGDHDIYGRMVQEDGSMEGDIKFALTNADDETAPAVAGSEGRLGYFVLWQHSQGVVDQPINGQLVSYAGEKLGPVEVFSGVEAENPAISAGQLGDFMVAYQDQPISLTHTNIYGRLWGDRIYLPLVIR